MRGGYFAIGLVLFAVSIVFTFVPFYDGYNLFSYYEYYQSIPGKIGRTIIKDVRADYSFVTMLVVINAIMAFAGLAFMIYGAGAKKD